MTATTNEGRVVLINGEPSAPESATVSVYDRGFLYGDSVFETIRSYGGRLFQLDEHLVRLEVSAASMGIAMPVTVEVLAEEVHRAVALSGNDESYVRLMLTRGAGPFGLDPQLAQEPLRVLFVQPLRMPPAQLYQNGVTTHCVETVRASDAADSAKLGNYVASVLALRAAREKGAQEALVINRDGLVVEGTTSNIFVLLDGVMTTPPTSAGVLAGITRGVVVQLIGELGIPFEERALPRAEVRRADEVFLTSSVRELVPVVEVDGQPIGHGKPGALTRKLHRAFRAHVGLGDELPWQGPFPSLGGAPNLTHLTPKG